MNFVSQVFRALLEAAGDDERKAQIDAFMKKKGLKTNDGGIHKGDKSKTRKARPKNQPPRQAPPKKEKKLDNESKSRIEQAKNFKPKFKGRFKGQTYVNNVPVKVMSFFPTKEKDANGNAVWGRYWRDAKEKVVIVWDGTQWMHHDEYISRTQTPASATFKRDEVPSSGKYNIDNPAHDQKVSMRRKAASISKRIGRALNHRRFDWGIENYATYMDNGDKRKDELDPWDVAKIFKTWHGKIPKGSKYEELNSED